LSHPVQHFEFPLVGDIVEVMAEGYRGGHYTVTDVEEQQGRIYVTIFAPCQVPGCDHDPYSTFPVSACRPHVSG
jgi:hypothetical protein